MARLTAAQRNKLPSKDFADPKNRKYPIEDKVHARAAKSRVSHFGSPAEKGKVAKKVAKKFPGIGKSSHGKAKSSRKRGRSSHKRYSK